MYWVLGISCWIGLVKAWADSQSPVGTWKTIDDKTGRPKSIVQITEQGGELSGKVLRVLESPEGPHPLCRRCEGERKDQPVEGMIILWGLKKNGPNWGDGQILDPENGRIYRVTLTPLNSGQKLDVHGYVGFSAIGRSQVWQREEEEGASPASKF